MNSNIFLRKFSRNYMEYLCKYQRTGFVSKILFSIYLTYGMAMFFFQKKDYKNKLTLLKKHLVRHRKRQDMFTIHYLIVSQFVFLSNKNLPIFMKGQFLKFVKENENLKILIEK